MNEQVILLSIVVLLQSINSYLAHPFHTLSTTRTKAVSSCSDVDSIFNEFLPNILKVRVPDTDGHAVVKEYIIEQLNRLDKDHWEVTLDTFEDNTPFGNKEFTNIIATLDPHVPNRLVLAAHYDSKLFHTGEFLGATDSALPVSLILDLVLTLDSKLKSRKLSHHSLQVIFFDGEEAFQRWTATDSIYGSRHLAAEMSKPDGLFNVDGKTGIEAIKYFVLLDLLGAKHPKIYNAYTSGESVFEKLSKIEHRLEEGKLLESHSSRYFETRHLSGKIEDDHIPFLNRGVPIVHIIPLPFPSVWHKTTDNLSAIDRDTVQNFKKIFMVFLYEYFNLQ